LNDARLDTELQYHLTVVDRSLKEEYARIFAVETTQRYIQGCIDQFADFPVKNFVPVMVERFAKERLRALGQAEGSIVKDVPEVLFVCTHNAGRSQMAAGLLQHHAAGRVHVRSAGSEPADQLNSAVVEAMAEIGLDVSQEFPKPLTDEVVRAADVVITMGCGDACPIYPGKRYLDWELDDPAGQSLETVRPIRDEIDRRVQTLIEELVPA
jgi:protein-tyrosine-phosphatase